MLEFFLFTPDIHRFLTVHMFKTHFLLENLWISKPFLGIPVKKTNIARIFLI